jgi:hypothetical protein
MPVMGKACRPLFLVGHEYALLLMSR